MLTTFELPGANTPASRASTAGGLLASAPEHAKQPVRNLTHGFREKTEQTRLTLTKFAVSPANRAYGDKIGKQKADYGKGFANNYLHGRNNVVYKTT